MLADDFIIIGKFGKTHGLKGCIRVSPYSDDFDNFLSYNLFVLRDGKFEPIRISSTMPSSSKEVLFVNFDGITTIEQASEYVNSFLYIKKSDLPALPEGEFYFEALEGMEVWLDTEKSTTVINSKLPHILLGKVEQLKNNFNQTLLIVVPTTGGLLKKRLFIPFRYQDTILSVDLANKKIYTNWYYEI